MYSGKKKMMKNRMHRAMGLAFVSAPLTFASQQPTAPSIGAVSQNATKQAKKVKKHKKSSTKNLPAPADARKSQGFIE
jgi:hypothetical protein